MRFSDTALFAESWNVAFRERPQGSILQDHNTPFVVIPNTSRHWAADPMVFFHQGETYIFAELYDYVLWRGVIGVTRYLGNGRFSPWKPIIQEDFHMSYPYVFRSGDESYMIPETSRHHKVLLYRAVEFPFTWKLERVLKENVQWADTTIYPTEDGFRGHTQSYETGRAVELELRFSQELELLEAIACPETDPKTHRPGGRPFIHSGSMFRVCQDCRDGYGKALFFRSEREELHLMPQDLRYSTNILLDGMHTYSATEEFEVIDIKTRRLNWVNLVMRIKHKLHL